VPCFGSLQDTEGAKRQVDLAPLKVTQAKVVTLAAQFGAQFAFWPCSHLHLMTIYSMR